MSKKKERPVEDSSLKIIEITQFLLDNDFELLKTQGDGIVYQKTSPSGILHRYKFLPSVLKKEVIHEGWVSDPEISQDGIHQLTGFYRDISIEDNKLKGLS